VPAKRIWNLGGAVNDANAVKKLEAVYFQEMKNGRRVLKKAAAALEFCTEEQLADATKQFAVQLGTEHLLAPEVKATRAHKPAADCTDATNQKRFERWELDIGGDQEGKPHPHCQSAVTFCPPTYLVLTRSNTAPSLAGFLEWLFQKKGVSKLVSVVRSLRSELDGAIPASLQYKLDAQEELCPAACAALYEDLRMTKRQYELLHRVAPKVFVSYYAVKQFWEASEPEFVPLYDKDEILVAWAVKDVKARIRAHLQAYVDGEVTGVPGKGCKMQLKHGGDNFSYPDFYRKLWPNEQYVLVLMPEGTSPNSTDNVTPLAFAHKQMETRALMEVIMGHIDWQIPRGTYEMTVGGESFTFEDFFMADRALADYVYGLSIHALSNCLRCFARFGPHVHGLHLCARRAVTRTPEVTAVLAACAEKHSDMMDLSLNARKQLMAGDPVVQAQLAVMANTAEVHVDGLHKNVTSYPKLVQLMWSQTSKPLTLTPVSRYMTEVCHWNINMCGNIIVGPKVKGEVAGLFARLGKQVDVDIEKNMEAVFKLESFPLMGLDANDAVYAFRNPDEWGKELFERHHLGSTILALCKDIGKVGRILMQSKVDGDDLARLTELCTKVGDTLTRCFSTSRTCPAVGAVHQYKTPQFPLGVPCVAVVYNFGWYDHDLLCHGIGLAEEHGSFIRYSSWVVECINKEWKYVLEHHTARGGGTAGKGDGTTDVARQCLKKMCQIFNPQAKAFSKKDTRVAPDYVCNRCKDALTVGHKKVCQGLAEQL
jgi:hypothetical protein